MRADREDGSTGSAIAGVALLALCCLASGAMAAQAHVAEDAEPRMAVLRGVVGRAVYVALPANNGYAWDWAARGERWLFDVPFKVRFVSDPRPTEIWTFPLARPGRILLDFVQRPVAGPAGESAATHSVRLWVMTPYEAQQHAPAELRDTLLLR